MIQDKFLIARKILKKEQRLVLELESLYQNLGRGGNRSLIGTQIMRIQQSLKKVDQDLMQEIKKISLAQPLPTSNYNIPEKVPVKKQEMKKTVKPLSPKIQPTIPHKKEKKFELPEIERKTLRRIGKKEKVKIVSGERKPSFYFSMSNRIFFGPSRKLAKKKLFQNLERDINKTNLQFILPSYIAVMLMNTLVAFVISIFIFLFFLFFNITATLPIITAVEESLGQRFLMVAWIMIIVPLGTFFVSYLYPSLERRAAENGINQEIPFATIHMAAISGSMVEPSKIFSIILSTKEYPFISKELTKLLNEINIYGKDLVTALKKIAYNSPSTKLSDLLNGLATTITSGGALPDFFDKRAETLLFEYRIEKEKVAKAAETFMDIYISVVIAAPMILMLLLVMMKISGLGLALSTPMIGLVMILGVGILNIIFLTFLFLKNPKE